MFEPKYSKSKNLILTLFAYAAIFGIYQLKDQTKIPYMEKKNNWFLPGKTSILPEAGFFSNFYKEDENDLIFKENP